MIRNFVLALFIAVAAEAVPMTPVAITHVTVIDVVVGASLRDVTVTIPDGRIVSVGHDAAPAGATIVDGRGKSGSIKEAGKIHRGEIQPSR